MNIKVEGKNLEVALSKAEGLLGVGQESIGYKVVDNSQGFLGFFGKKVFLEAWIKKNPKKNRHPFKESRRDEKEVSNLSPQESEKLIKELEEFAAEVLSRMLGEEVETQTQFEGNRLVINILNDQAELLSQKNSKLCESLEHIIRKKPRHLKQELPFRIFVDFNDSRKKRENELVDMAQNLSDKVSKNRKPIVLNYKSSYDRKIIHMALDNDQRVYTKSIGSGNSRKLMILPVKKNPIESDLS